MIKYDGGTNFILRIKEQETRLTLQEHDDDYDDDDDIILCDHRHKCGPSLTETSLCGAYLYFRRKQKVPLALVDNLIPMKVWTSAENRT